MMSYLSLFCSLSMTLLCEYEKKLASTIIKKISSWFLWFLCINIFINKNINIMHKKNIQFSPNNNLNNIPKQRCHLRLIMLCLCTPPHPPLLPPKYYRCHQQPTVSTFIFIFICSVKKDIICGPRISPIALSFLC